MIRELGAILAVAAVVLFAGGCLVVPLPEHGLLGGRGEITPEQVESFEPGVTSCAEILLEVGEPELILEDGRYFTYHWSVTQGAWAIAAGNDAAGGPIAKAYLFMVEFDDAGHVARLTREPSPLFRGWVDHVHEWTGVPMSEVDAAVEGRAVSWRSGPAMKRQGSLPVKDIRPDVQSALDLASARLPPPPAAATGTAVLVHEFRDPRDVPDVHMLSPMRAAFSVKMSDLRLRDPPARLIHDTLAEGLTRAGCRMTDDRPSVEVLGTILEFDLVSTTDFAWKMNAHMVVEIEVRHFDDAPIVRRYTASGERTDLIWPRVALLEEAVEATLADLLVQIMTDPSLE